MDLTKHNNCKSYHEEAEAADADFVHIVAKVHTEFFGSAAAVTARFGEVCAPKVDVVAKLKESKKKLRLIVDMLRSGTHGRNVVKERLVLPRMTNFAESIVDHLNTSYTLTISELEPARDREGFSRLVRVPLRCN